MSFYRFIHGSIFDGESNEVKQDQVLTLRDGKIESIHPFQPEVDDSGDAIDCTGLFIMPGLIDCHANIVGLTTEEQKYGLTPKTIASSTLRGVYGGRNCIHAGVTTIRVDTAGHHGTYALRDSFESGMFVGPRMIMPGRGICTTCGHGWNFGNHVADGPWEIRKAVREEIMAGAEWIKLMITGGAGTATEQMEDQQMCREEIMAGVDEAHARGKKCFAHLTTDCAINDALDAGIDSVEHGILMEKRTAEKMASLGTYLVPTLGVYRRLVDQGKKGMVPDYMYQKSLKIVERHTESFKYAVRAGVRIASGTDSGQDWFPLGTSMLRELEIMNEEGLSSAETLKTATSNAADLLGISNIGRLTIGNDADILIIEGNPILNISDIRRTRFVIKCGKIVYVGDDKINARRRE